MKTNHSAPGRRWAYFGLLLGMAASTTGNVANTVLTASDVHLGLRVPFAVLWPVLTWVAIEILTRTIWSRSFAHVATRAVLAVPVGIVAAFVSYLHLHHLMVMAGEPGPAQAVGPLAIDGMLFGCTVALLVTRAQERATGSAVTKRTLAERVQDLRATVDATLAAVKTPAVDPIGAEPAPCMADVELGPEAPEPVATQEDPEPEAQGSPKIPAPRRPRVTDWDLEKVVQMILEGSANGEVASAANISPSVVKRVRRAVTAIRADRHADIPADWKVPAPVVTYLREEARRWA
jgi:hypothetical protein